ncbi:MAG: helix-turn-helix domain-containing protein [Candidatus Nanopelagicales bacterium]
MTTSAPTHTITVAQAAETLGVSERTVWRYLKSGRLPGETVGEPGSQRTLIPADAVDALQGSRGGADADALRAERDRLVAELAATQAERDQLRGRVGMLQRALSTPARPGIGERLLTHALGVVARARGPREHAVR